MSQRVGPVADCRVDVLPGEPWESIEQIGLADPLAELTKNLLYRDACSPNDRFSQHYPGSDLDAISNRHGEPLVLRSVFPAVTLALPAVLY